MTQVAVVGAGLTGLAAAYYLEQSYDGLEIDLYDPQPHVGGWIRTDTSRNLVIEGGPDSFLATKPDLVALCEALGLGNRLIGTNSQVRGAYIYWNHRFMPIPEGIQTGVPTKAKPVLASPLLSLTGKVALAKDFVLLRGTTGDQSLGHFLRRRFGNQIVDRLAAPMLSGIFAGDIDQMSLKATFPHLLEAEQQARSVYVGSKRRKPAPPSPYLKRYHSVFLTTDQGLQQIPEAIAQHLKHSHLLLNNGVEKVEPIAGGGFTVYGMQGAKRYDAVIMTTPAFVSARALPFLPDAATNILQSIPYADLAVIGAAYHSEDVPMKTDKTGFLVPHQTGLRMTAVTWVSSKWRYPHVDPLFVLRAFYGRATENILTLSDDELLNLYYDEIKKTMGISHAAEYQRVFRIPKGMPQYIVGHLDRMQQLHQYLQAWPQLFLLGAFEGGVGMPDRVHQALVMAQAFGPRMGLEPKSAAEQGLQ
ncbi:MAG: protoporphyrinogen oxidase [Sulfobacillus thermosulfidooxidans]|nr:MAG: protoporphyrinogen oxidase [Sulfobacillus thermosulfidooxidans]